MLEDKPNTDPAKDAALRITAGAAGDAIAPLLDILARAPGDCAARYALAAAQLKSGNPSAALAEFDALLGQVPGHCGAAYGRGLALFALGERRAALSVFRQLTEPGPFTARTWASIADITPDEAERQHALEAAADTLVHLCARSGVAADRRAAAAALLAARRPQEAAALLAPIRGPVSGAPVPDRLRARALYHQGRFEEAFGEVSRVLANTPVNGAARKPAPAFDPDYAAKVLIEILQVLTNAGAAAFLSAGTLLGFRRNNGPLPYDRDIDIGVIRSPDGGPDIAAILRAHDTILLPRITRPGDRYIGLRHRGVAVDIFLHEPAGRHLTCGFSDTIGDIQWRFTRFEIAYAHLGGRSWPVPAMPERYLAQAYGPRWEIPDRGFASVISSPALYRTDLYARAYYAATRARTALLKGDYEKVRALLHQSPVALRLPSAEQLDHAAGAPD